MPEYSGTTIPPADGVQVPAMNGASGGNFVLSALRNYILASKGQANGLASLDGNGKLPAAQLPDLADDVIVVASYVTLPAQGESGKIYITADNNKLYRWDSNASNYVVLLVDLSAYATKAELNADVATLQSQIDRNKAEIENLKQTTKQDEQTVQYPDDGNYSSLMPNKVPLSVADYAEVPTIRGKSRGWNQLAFTDLATLKSNNSAGSWSNNVYTFNGITFTVDTDGTISVAGTASDFTYFMIAQGVLSNGHTCLLYGCPTGGSQSSYSICPIGYNGYADEGSGYIVSGVSTPAPIIIKIESGTVISTPVKFRQVVRDLTPIFPEGVPATVADCVKAIPDIVKNEDFTGYSLVKTTVEGVEAIGVNIWDEQWTANVDSINSKNLIPVNPSTDYYFKIPTGWLTVTEYDVNQNPTGTSYSIVNNNRTTGASCAYLSFVTSSAYGNTYNHDIQICLNSYADKTTYHPYQRNTLMLSSSVTLKSAGSVAEVLDVQTGKKTRPIGVVDLSTLSWGESGGIYYTSLADMASDAEGVCSKYVVTHKNAPDLADGEMNCGYNAGYLQIRTSSSPTGILNYQLATPLADEQVCDPIPDNFLEVEAGGTINTIQSQSPVIDNCLDVTYDFIPA